jgi:hypothetical protein
MDATLKRFDKPDRVRSQYSLNNRPTRGWTQLSVLSCYFTSGGLDDRLRFDLDISRPCEVRVQASVPKHENVFFGGIPDQEDDAAIAVVERATLATPLTRHH